MSINRNNSSQVNNLIARLHAQHIHIEPSQAQFLLDATGGDADMALALYWEDSVANAARERDRERQAHAGDANQRDSARDRAHLENDPELPAHDRGRREHNRERRDRARLRHFLRHHERLAEERRELGRDEGMNRAREREDRALLRNRDEESNRDVAHRVDLDPANHVSISDDETNFNERFLKRIKDHMKRRSSRGLFSLTADKKKRRILHQPGKLNSWADNMNAFFNMDEVSGNMNNGGSGEVLEDLLKISTELREGGSNNKKNSKKENGLEYEFNTGASRSRNINDDVSDDDEEELDSKYAEALNLLDSTAGTPSYILWGNINRVPEVAASRTFRSEIQALGDGDNSGDTLNVDHSQRASADRSHYQINGEVSRNRNSRGESAGDTRNRANLSDSDDDSSRTEEDVRIPRTWLSAGFNLSSCGSGLVLSSPDDTDLARLKSIQNTLFTPGASSMSPPLPPFHCGGITMLTSLVTALIYSGVCTHGTEIIFENSCRKPFAHLSSTEKKQQFPSRLADALSALLVVAAETSVKYRLDILDEISKKINVYRDSYKSDRDSDDEEYEDTSSLQEREVTIKRVMRTRAKLCPVCRWDESGNNRDLVPLDRDTLKMQVSFTNHNDMKAYVIANLHSFMAPGGCALFLETIFHIHGQSRIQKMLEESSLNNGKKRSSHFVKCNCERKLKEEWAMYLLEKKNNPFLQQKDWSRPLCKDCVGTDLISLLITGKPHAEMHGWCAEKFGMGFLNGDMKDEEVLVNAKLKLPRKPVWLVEGDDSYFVIWSNNLDIDVHHLDRSSYSFTLSTWDCWDDEEQKETYRIMTKKRNDTCAPSDDMAHKPITKAEIDQVQVNPEDRLNYANFRRWRYFFPNCHGEKSDGNTATDWIPFFKLNDRQKAIVKRRIANPFEFAIWSIWPDASIEEILCKG